MEAIGRSVLLLEYHLAQPPSETQLHQAASLVLTLSWTVFFWAILQHFRCAFQGWALPGVQAGGLQVLLALVASAAPPTLAVNSGRCSAVGRALGLLFQGSALLFASVSLPRRVVRLCVPEPERHAPLTPTAGVAGVASRVGCGLVAAATFLLFRPVVCLAAHGVFGGMGQKAKAPEVVLDALLLAVGIAVAWWAGQDCRHGILGPHLPLYSSVYHVVCGLSCAWALTASMTIAVDGRPENAVLAEMIKVVEVAFAVAWVASRLAPSRDPLLQMALTQSRPHSESEPDDLLAQGVKGWRGILRALLLVFNVWQPIQEAAHKVQSKPGLIVQQEVTPLDSREDTGIDYVDEAAELQAHGREVTRGCKAWREWASTSGVHPLWPGVEDSGAGCLVLYPATLTSEEENLKVKGVLEKRSTWQLVLVDLFTNRVCSKPLAVLVVLTLAVRAIDSDMATYITVHFTNPALALAIQIGCLACLWIFCGIALLGNNPFVDARIRPIWAVALGLGMLLMSYRHVLDCFQPPRGASGDEAWSVGDVHGRADNLSLAFISLAGAFMVGRIALQRHGADDYHRTEISAMWYTTDLLRPHGSVADLRARPPQQGERLRFMAGRAGTGTEVSVQSVHGDGTCDVRLKDGRAIKCARYTDLKREVPEGRVEEESKDRRLDRLKKIFSAAEEYPGALYFGVAATLPFLVSVSCTVLGAVKGFVHQIYRAHVVATLLNFYLWAQVTGPPGSLQGEPIAMTASVEAWRLSGGTGLATPARLAAAGIPELHFRWGGGTEQDDRYPCTELKVGSKLLALLADGAASSHFHGLVKGLHWHDVAKGLEEAGPIWSLPEERMQDLQAALHHFWRSLSAGDPNFALDSAGMGTLLCEAGLLLNRPAAAVPQIVPMASGLARDLVGGLRKRLADGRDQLDTATHKVDPPLIRHMVQDAGLDLLGNLETALDNITRTLEQTPEDPLKGIMDAVDTFKNHSEAHVKDVAIEFAKEEAKQLGILAAQRLKQAAEDQAKQALREGKAHLKGEINGLIGDRLEKLDKAARDRLGNFTTNFIEREVRRLERDAKATLKRQVAKLVEQHMKEVEDALMAQLPDSAEAIAKGLEVKGQGRRMREAHKAEEVEQAGKAEELGPTDAAATAEGSPSLSALLRVVKDEASPFVNVIFTVIGILQQDWIAWALIGMKVGVRLCLVCAVGCQLYVMARCFWKYRELFESMQAGRHTYLGHTCRESLAGGFAETTIFPGIFLGTSAIGCFIMAFVTFVVLVVLVLLLLPMCAMQWLAPYWPVLKYILLALVLKKLVQTVLLDWLLVDCGEIQYPNCFSALWFIQLFLNFVIGVSAAAARAVVVVLVSALSCCLVDTSLLPESLVSLDSAYYSLLALAYTNHERLNPVKLAATTVICPWTHRVYGPSLQKTAETQSEHAASVEDGGDARPSQALLRARARFCLLLTLHRNPELRSLRRP